jgi:hypothetical protein
MVARKPKRNPGLQETRVVAHVTNRFCALFLSGATALLIVTVVAATANAQMGKGTPFCKSLYNPNLNPTGKIFASHGAQMYCFGSPLGANRPQILARRPVLENVKMKNMKNVDAANPGEDISPNGTQVFGQSETSIAAVDQYVVEAWNDATGLLAPCPSPNSKEEGTGFGFSNNGGSSFTDLGGLPNVDCAGTRFQGDPSVEAWGFQGGHYFYISSLFATVSGLEIAVTACQVIGSGASATLSCGQPTVVATSPTGFDGFSFLDKPFAAIDPMRGRLYITYADFGAGDSIALAACDLTNNPMQPVCSNGSSNGPTYVVVAAPDPNSCQNEGAYPAVDVSTGDVYVAYEHNWPSVFAVGVCTTEPTKEVVTHIPNACLTLPGPSACTGPFTQTAELVTSLSGAFVPGYNRFPMNDFPRIAVSSTHGTVSILWNDARFKPTGDILLQSWSTGNAFPTPIQLKPVVVDRAATAGHGWQFLPAMRNADDDGNLFISWYGRAIPATAVTNLYAAVGVSPLTHATPSNIRITDVGSDWNAVSSDIIPNFGDYTDNYVGAVVSFGPPFTGKIGYTAWSDGRLGIPQPFEARVSMK